MATRGIIYYSHRDIPKIGQLVRDQLSKIDLPIVSCTLYPVDFGKNVVLDLGQGYLTMFKQILTALENSDADIVYFCEHDNVYHPSHFDYTPPTNDKFYYDLAWWKIRKDGLAVTWEAVQVSGLVCYKQLAIDFYRKRIAEFDARSFDRKFEPTVDDLYETWWAKYPSIDIRHDSNTTYNKWKLEHFRKKDTAVNFVSDRVENIPGWSPEELTLILDTLKE